MGNPKFNSKMLKYFLSNDNDVTRFFHTKYIESKSDYYDFFSYFLNKYGIAISIVANIQHSTNTYRAYINFAPNNILNEQSGEVSLIEEVSSDVANEVLGEKLIKMLEMSTYDDWTNPFFKL